MSDRDEIGIFVDIPPGNFIMGASPLYPEEGPPKKVFVSAFRIQAHEVTNSQFAAFVAATGYVTEAERHPGSALFRYDETRTTDLSWWQLEPSATWRTPAGAGSSIRGLDLHPVVHVSLNDARAYAKWAGGRLPTEVEWEYVARLGAFDADDSQSGVRSLDGRPRANIWTGAFPAVNTAEDGYTGTAPVGCFERTPIGTYDMIGNVWEWTESAYGRDLSTHVIKGGSHLCSANYCQRYRPPARQSLEADHSASHVGFRIVRDRASSRL